MSSSSSPCAACKFLRRKCTTDCVFSPYFPADNPKRFADVHKVFGASNVAKILNDIDISHREDAVQSLAYEANARIEDPVYGCVGQISHMQKTVSNLHMRLEEGKKELASLVGPTAMFQMLQDPVPRAQYNIMPASSTMLGLDRQQQYRLQQEQYHRQQQQQQQQQQIGAHIMHQWMQQSERQQQHLQMTLQQPHQQGGVSGGGGQLVIRERQQHKEQLLERQMQVREQQNQVHGGQVVIRDATAQLQQINSQEQDQLVVALQVKEEQEMFRSVEEMHQQAQMEVIRQQREVELMRLQEQQLRHMEARGRGGGGGGGGGEGPSGTAELSPLLALGTGFNAMNPYHVQQQEHQQQEEIHDIQLFSDPNLHPPEPENGG